MKMKFNRKGFTLLELLIVAVIIGILAAMTVGRFLVAKDRSHIAAAHSDVDHIRKALAYYSVDYGIFPDNNFSDTESLAATLVDPEGNHYVVKLTDNNFETFAYTSVDNGNEYEIQAEALDNANTVILATAEGSNLQ